MADSSLTVDLIDGFDRLSLNLLSKSSPSSVSPFQVNHSQQQQGNSLGIQNINTSPLPTKSNAWNNKGNIYIYVNNIVFFFLFVFIFIFKYMYLFILF